MVLACSSRFALWLGLLPTLACGTSYATEQASACDSSRLATAIARLGDVYLGELHGTNEVPLLVEQVVRVRLSEYDERPVIVSLELPARALDTRSGFWSGRDGRASEAMARLVRFLAELEQAHPGEVRLHFQQSPPAEGAVPVDGSERGTGLRLAALAGEGVVIALGGNHHSRKANLDGMSGESAGMVAGDNVLGVAVMPARGGTGWMCFGADDCGPKQIPAFPKPPQETEHDCLFNGESVVHDHLALLERFSVSPPERDEAAD